MMVWEAGAIKANEAGSVRGWKEAKKPAAGALPPPVFRLLKKIHTLFGLGDLLIVRIHDLVIAGGLGGRCGTLGAVSPC